MGFKHTSYFNIEMQAGASKCDGEHYGDSVSRQEAGLKHEENTGLYSVIINTDISGNKLLNQ